MPAVWIIIMKTNLHEEITNHIIAAMKDSKGCEMPWHKQAAMPINATTDNHYNGINALSLWVISQEKSYGGAEWATYKQWQSLGAQVAKGEKGSKIVIYKPLPKTEEDDGDRPKVLLRSATVFNVAQVVGWEPPQPLVDKTKVIVSVDKFVSATGAVLEHGGDRAYYTKALDKIVMPDRELFKGTKTSNETEAYYAVLLHELTHWTGIKSRCDRDMSGRFGDASYAMEELVAELGSAFACAQLGVTNSPRQDHADYIASWINVLEKDPKAVFWASARASEAVAYLNSLQT